MKRLADFFKNTNKHEFIFQMIRTCVEIRERRKKQWPKLRAREGEKIVSY